MTAELKTKVFEHRSIIPTTMARMIAFHSDPRTLLILTPPPIGVQIIRDDKTSLINGEVEFRLWFGPFPIHWIARHEPGPTSTSFIDRMIQGPVEWWEHQHILRPTEGGVELIDHITFAHKPLSPMGLFTRLFFDGLPLRFLFIYRHLRTRLAVTRRVPESAA